MRLNHKRLGLLGAHVARGVGRLVRLTPARLDFVTLLVRGPLCQRDLAAQLCVTEGVISRMVRGLMALGFVQREIPVADRRFRLVSLTNFGREQFRKVSRADWLLDPDGRCDAQAVGESLWNYDWQLPLEKMGLDWLENMASSDFTAAPPEPPPYAAIRRHRRMDARRDPLANDDCTVSAAWPWTVVDLAPPLEAGLSVDPLSQAMLAAWRPPRGLSSTEKWDSPHDAARARV